MVDSETIEQRAAKFAEQIDDDDIHGGVRTDLLMLAELRAGELAHEWQEVYLRMDSMIDGGEFIPDTMMEDIAEIHRTAQEHQQFYECLRKEFDDRRMDL